MASFLEQCKEQIFCPRTALVLLIVAVAIIGVALTVTPSITQLSHIYVHNPGECHINTECNIGEICFKDCVQFNQNGMCTSQEAIGNCTKYCSSNSDCGSGNCTSKVLWQGLSSDTVSVCV